MTRLLALLLTDSRPDLKERYLGLVYDGERVYFLVVAWTGLAFMVT